MPALSLGDSSREAGGKQLTASISQHTATANLLPAGSLCLLVVDSTSGRQPCLKSPGLEETGRSPYCSSTSLCIDLARSKQRLLPVIMNYL